MMRISSQVGTCRKSHDDCRPCHSAKNSSAREKLFSKNTS